MATPTKTEERLDEVFTFVRQREEEAMKTARTWVTTVGDALPVEFPLVFELTREFLDFTEELLRIQREFARDMLTETHALVHRVSEGRVTTARPAQHAPRPTPAAKARKPAA